MRKIRRDEFEVESYLDSNFRQGDLRHFSLASWISIYLVSENYQYSGKAMIVAREKDSRGRYIFLGKYTPKNEEN